MALPHTPKIDWAAADGVTETNLNEIGANLNYLAGLEALGNIFELSSFLDQTQSFTGVGHLAVIKRVVPDGKSLLLNRVSWYFSTSTARARVMLSLTPPPLGGGYTSSTSEGDDPADTGLYSNSSGADVEVYIGLGVSDTGSVADPSLVFDAYAAEGVYAQIQLIDTP